MRILYLDVDSLRSDHLGCYGYERPTSPNIDALAARSNVLGSAFTSSSPCMPSRACLMSGRFGIRHGVLTHWGPGADFHFPGLGHTYFDEAPIFTRYLRQHGYETVSFSSFMDRHQAFWFGAGWSAMNTFTLKQGDEDADEVNAAAIPWIREHAVETENLFLHLQYWDPHRNYTVGERFVREVESAPIPGWLTDEVVAGHQSSYGPFTARELFPGRRDRTSPVAAMPRQVADLDDAHRFVDGYDGAIRFLDAQIGELLAVLDERGILDETAIILSADHGEALGEGGVYGDHTSAAEAVHHVPMIVHWPGQPAGRVDGLVYQFDMVPTLLDLLGLPIPDGWDARSFAADVRGDPDWVGRPTLVWDHALYSAQRVVRTADWTYQRTYHPGVFEHAPVSLFSTGDPHQQHDVAGEHPDIVDDLDRHLTAWRRENLAATGLADLMDEILATGGPFRYVHPDQWARTLREEGRDDAADRMLRAIAEHAQGRIDA